MVSLRKLGYVNCILAILMVVITIIIDDREEPSTGPAEKPRTVRVILPPDSGDIEMIDVQSIIEDAADPQPVIEFKEPSIIEGKPAKSKKATRVKSYYEHGRNFLTRLVVALNEAVPDSTEQIAATDDQF